MRIVEDNGVEVVVPPLHHQVVTATREGAAIGQGSLTEAQSALEDVLARLDERFEPTPAGLGVTVAWGLPYFRRFVPKLADEHIPVDRRATKTKQKPVRVLLDARRFPSDPPRRSSRRTTSPSCCAATRLDHIAAAQGALRRSRPVRRDQHPQGLRRRRLRRRAEPAEADGRRRQRASGSFLIPDHSELFLGFTSTQKAGLGPPKIANLEELGFSEGGYFAQGTHLALSHITEDLEAWYVNFPHEERVATVFRPGLKVPRRCAHRPARARTTSSSVGAGASATSRATGGSGHSASLQTVSRLSTTAVGASGAVYGPGTAIPHRADFNTLDNPFFWSADPATG